MVPLSRTYGAIVDTPQRPPGSPIRTYVVFVGTPRRSLLVGTLGPNARVTNVSMLVRTVPGFFQV